MDRKDLLMMSSEPPKAVKEDKAKMKVEEMYALKATIESRGWKNIIAGYIQNRLTMDRFLQTKTAQERHEIWGALKEMQAFVDFLNSKIKEGEDAALLLSSKREENNE